MEEITLSLALSFLAPFRVSCMDSSRRAVPSPENRNKVEEQINQEILAVVLSSFMTMAKPVTPHNTPAFTKRWKAALSSQNISDLIPQTSWVGITEIATIFHTAVTGRPLLRKEITDRMLSMEKHGPHT